MGITVIDRALSDQEKKTVGRQEKIDLTGTREGSRIAPFSRAIIDWSDGINETQFNGQSPYDFFMLGEQSYWLHARFTLFMALYSDAQILDAIPDVVKLKNVTTVYCATVSIPFWKRWTPQARLVASADTRTSSRRLPVLVSFLGRLVSQIPASFRALKRVRRDPPRRLFFSASANNIERDGKLWDRQFGPLFDRMESAYGLRIEFAPLPNAGFDRPSPNPAGVARTFPTLSTDLLLIQALLKHPYLLVRLLKNLRVAKSRFGAPIRQNTTFPFGSDVWQKLIEETIAGLAPSIALWDLFRHVFRMFVSEVTPSFACISSESNNIGRLFAEECKRQDILTVGYQHGAVAPHNVDYRYGPADVPHGIPDQMLVWSSSTRTYLVSKSNFPSDRVHVCGRLLNDDVVAPTPDSRIVTFRQDTQKPVLFFASQPQQNERSRIETADLLAKFCSDQNIVCAVKLHPREPDDGLYSEVFERRYDLDALLISEGKLHESIIAADFGGTCFSTVAWEIMHLRRLLIVFDPLRLNLLGLRDEDSVFHADRLEQSFAEWQRDDQSWIETNYQLAMNELGPDDGQNVDRMLSILGQITGSD